MSSHPQLEEANCLTRNQVTIDETKIDPRISKEACRTANPKVELLKLKFYRVLEDRITVQNCLK